MTAAALPSPLLAAVQLRFDAGYYLARYPDVRRAGVDPLDHYLTRGWHEGRDPGRYFSTRLYLDHVPDLRGGTVCPLVHFVQAQLRPGPRPCPDPVEARMIGDLPPFLMRLAGWVPGMPGDDLRGRLLIRLFDAEAYRSARVIGWQATLLDLLADGLASGAGIPARLPFDAAFHAAELARRGMPAARGDAFADWLHRGIDARIVPTALFDTGTYLHLNPDVAGFSGWAFEHWLRHGLDEGRPFRRSLTLARTPPPGAPDRRTTARRLAEAATPAVSASLNAMERFRNDGMADLIARAQALDPAIGTLPDRALAMLPPFHDGSYAHLRACLDLLPPGTFDTVVAVPFGKLGGADYVAGLLCRALLMGGRRVLILRTDAPDWDRPDWYPAGAAVVDVSGPLKSAPAGLRSRLLYALLRRIGPRAVFNVNSRLMFDTLDRFGARLAGTAQLFAWYFCADRTPDGAETGYPVHHFAGVLPCLTAALTDHAGLAQTLIARHGLPPDLARRVRTVYSPSPHPVPPAPIAEAQVASRPGRPRPRFLWAGRLDRQKRFDLVVAVARLMPDCDFLCRGQAVLDSPPSLEGLPGNLVLQGAFDRIEDLPLGDCDGWLYTSAWDGLPTILIEAARLGMPVVASAVGGVPELITEKTGWPVPDVDDPAAHAAALRTMLSDPQDRLRRATALQALAAQRHGFAVYVAALDGLLGPARAVA